MQLSHTNVIDYILSFKVLTKLVVYKLCSYTLQRILYMYVQQGADNPLLWTNFHEHEADYPWPSTNAAATVTTGKFKRKLSGS